MSLSPYTETFNGLLEDRVAERGFVVLGTSSWLYQGSARLEDLSRWVIVGTQDGEIGFLTTWLDHATGTTIPNLEIGEYLGYKDITQVLRVVGQECQEKVKRGARKWDRDPGDGQKTVANPAKRLVHARYQKWITGQSVEAVSQAGIKPDLAALINEHAEQLQTSPASIALDL